MASQDEISKHRGATTEGETSNHPAATTEGDMSMKGSLQLTSHHNQTENAVEDSEQKIISKDNTGSCETMHPTTIHSTTIALPVKRNLLEDHTYTLAGEDGFVRDGLSCKTEDQSYAEEQLSPKRRKLSPPVADPTDLQYRRSTSPNEEKLRSRLRSPSITPSCASSLTTLDQLEARGMSPPRGCDASNVTTHSNRSTPGRAQSQSQNKPKTTKFAEKESKLVEKAAEKARKDQDREARRKQKQLDDAIKDEKRRQREAERAAKDEQKRLRDEEKKKKEDEKAKFEEEKRRRDGVQRTLGSFFATPKQRVAAVANAPVTVVTSGLESHTTEVPSEGTTNHPYRKLFPPFYLNEHVQLAPTCRFAHGNLDEAWDVHALDAILAGDSHASTSDALAIFRQGNTHRGTSFPSVRSIIANMDGISNNGGGNSESQSSQMIRGREQLQQVPVKYIKFAEDVRPPYRGTFTMSPLHGIHKLARSPWRRDHPSTDYNYDSEAEWVEDEDAEDCESNGDEEEEIEDAEEMDDFLDDENDDLLHARRPVFHGELVPTSTGLCWEDQRPPCANADLMVYKMEVIIGSFHILELALSRLTIF